MGSADVGDFDTKGKLALVLIELTATFPLAIADRG
jgi:hypothetical protein